jgi:ubiquitin-protein ligase E3 A
VDLYVKWLLEDSIEKQFDSFFKGFKLLCDTPGFNLFRAEELELLISGSPVLDFEALEKNTIYDNGYSKDHPVIKYFFHYNIANVV